VKVLLEIGYQQLLLPDDKHLATVLRVLSQAANVSRCWQGQAIHLEAGPVQVRAELVPDSREIVLPGGAPLAPAPARPTRRAAPAVAAAPALRAPRQRLLIPPPAPDGGAA
jgi:hypothetical protein